jgi:hypothetical protein
MNNMFKSFSIALLSFCILANADKLDNRDALMIASKKVEELSWLLQNNNEFGKSVITERKNEQKLVNLSGKDSQYNDTLCQSQLLYLLDGLNKSALYAFQGEHAIGNDT